MIKFTKNQLIIIVSIAAVILTVAGFFTIRWLIARNAGANNSSSLSSASTVSQEDSSSQSSTASQDPVLSVDGSILTDTVIGKALDSLISKKTAGAATLAEQKARFDKIDFEHRLFRPVFNTKVQLYVATLASKPAILPSAAMAAKPPAVSTASAYAASALIDSTASPVRWFAMTKDPSLMASKFIWQVGTAPFPGAGDTQLDPPGLISSGEIAAGASDFSIDFSTIVNKKQIAGIRRAGLSPALRIFPLVNTGSGTPAIQKVYYVRVIPIGKDGKAIGDGGTGMPVLYGKPVTATNHFTRINILTKKFTLLSLNDSGKPYLSGEFANYFENVNSRFMDSRNEDLSYYFLPENTPGDTITYVIQVSKDKLPSEQWDTAPGLVYERRIHSGTPEFDTMSKFNSIQVNFAQFAPADSLLKPEEKLVYHVRLVALAQGKDPGTVFPTFAPEVVVNYGRPAASTIKIYPTVTIDAQLPEIVSYSYTPARWEASDWAYHYVVIRQPSEKEIFPGGFVGSDKPFAPYTVGTKLDFTPQPPEDTSWWEDAINAISDFFSDFTGFLGDIVNWVSKTYANLKSGLIQFVAKTLTYLTPSLRGLVEDALTGLVDYGLASMGIPPTLPNFDELASMGVDYLATMALESAGVPASDYIKDGVVDIANGVKDGLTASTNTGSPNPFNWNFIKLDPDYLYRPAYVLVELYNPSSETSPAGYISGSNEFIIDTKKMLTGTEEYLYARFGGNVYYKTFKTISGQKIPPLAPKQKLVIPIFLEEYVGESFWSNGPKTTRDDMKSMYYGLGQFDFSFSFQYDLPSASEKAKELKLPADAIYQYKSTGSSIQFKTEPYTAVASK